MKLFKRLQCCEVCGAAYRFEPTDEVERDFTELCAVHREEPLKEARLQRAVLTWARLNWRRLEEQMRAEQEAAYAAARATNQSRMAQNLAGQAGQANAARQWQNSGLGSLYGLQPGY